VPPPRQERSTLADRGVRDGAVLAKPTVSGRFVKPGAFGLES
jgi:hypothetical protein